MKGFLGKISPLFVVLAIAVICNSCVKREVEAARPTQAAQYVDNVTNVDEQPEGELHIDETISMKQEHRQIAIRSVASQLPDLTLKWNVGRWSFFVFSDNGWLPTQFYNLDVPSFKKPACGDLPVSDLERLKRGREQNKKQQAETRCNELLRSAQREYREELVTLFNQAKAHILAQPTADKSRCTAIWDLVMNLSMKTAPTRALIISDGKEECLRGKLKQIPPPTRSVQVVMVLLPTLHPDQPGLTAAEQFHDTREKWLRIAPWLKIVSPSASISQ